MFTQCVRYPKLMVSAPRFISALTVHLRSLSEFTVRVSERIDSTFVQFFQRSLSVSPSRAKSSVV